MPPIEPPFSDSPRMPGGVHTARPAEMRLLEEMWQAASSGEPRLALVQGEAGMGKSWLTRAFCSRIPSQTIRVTRGPLFPNLLRAAMPLLARDLDPDLRKAAEGLRETGPRLPTDGSPSTELARDGALLALARGLGRAAWRTSGLCLLVEDLHSMSEADLSAVALLHRFSATSRSPILLLLTCRSDARALWWAAAVRDSASLQAPAPELLYLQPLDESGTALLARELLYTDDLPDLLLPWLHERANGHPLHTTELLRFLLDGGALTKRGYLWHFAPPSPSLLPHGLEATLRARVGGVRGDPESWRALSGLAILNRPATLDEWASAVGMSHDALAETSSELVRLALVDALLQAGKPHFQFAHALYAPIVNGMIDRESRRRLHARVAESSKDVGERALHARLAGHDRAVQWTWTALASARGRGDHRDAEVHARALLDLDPSRKGEAIPQLGESLYYQGKYEEALSILDGNDSEHGWWYSALALRRLGRWSEALALSRRGAEAKGPAGNRFRALEAGLLLQLGLREEGAREVARLLTEAPAESFEQALALLEQGRLAHSAHDFQEALEHTEAAARLFRRLGESEDLCRALNNIGIYASNLGRWPTSEAALSECIALSEARGDRANLASRYLNRGNLHYRKGEYARALAAFKRSLYLAEESDDHEVRTNALLSLAEIALLSGEVASARELYRDGLERLRESSGALGNAYRLALLHASAYVEEAGAIEITAAQIASHPLAPLLAAEILLHQARAEQARDLLARVEFGRLRKTAQAQYQLVSSLVDVSQGRLSDAARRLEETRELARVEGHLPFEGQALCHLALVARLQGKDPLSRSLAEQGLALIEESGAWGHLLALKKLFPDDARALLEAGQVDGVASETRNQPMVRTLGRFELETRGELRSWRARKVKEMLGLLVLAELRESVGGVPRHQIITALWPDAPPRQAELSFRSTVHRLRRALGSPLSVERLGNGDYRLRDVTTDVSLFQRALTGGDLELALAWYEGDFLPGTDLPGVQEAREYLRSRFREAALDVASRCGAEQATELYGRLLEDDPFDLTAVRGLAVALARAGDVQRLKRTIDTSQRRFSEEFGEVPRELVELDGLLGTARAPN